MEKRTGKRGNRRVGGEERGKEKRGRKKRGGMLGEGMSREEGNGTEEVEERDCERIGEGNWLSRENDGRKRRSMGMNEKKKREEEIQEKRDRGERVPEWKDMSVDVIPATRQSSWGIGKLKERSHLRVAAYCRVSTGDESQQTSYTNQKAFYTELIQNREGWVLAGIYADEAISGTSRARRAEFNRMMEEAKAGKMDYIVTKSISRFARNTVDTLNCVRELKNQIPPVGIYFEKENLDTLDAAGELILTILSALAQDESRSISDNIRWTFQKKFQAGIPQVNLSRMLGYDKGADGEWVINLKQAMVVRYIFERFVSGCSANRIAKELNAAGRFTVNGKNWSSSTVLSVLRNEKYVGDVEMQKTVTKDFLTHRSVKNTGEAPRYYVKNHHAGIVERPVWERVQAILNRTWPGMREKETGKFREICMAQNAGAGEPGEELWVQDAGIEKIRAQEIGDREMEARKRKRAGGSPFRNLRCGAHLESGQECGMAFFRLTYSNVTSAGMDDAENEWSEKIEEGKEEGKEKEANGMKGASTEMDRMMETGPDEARGEEEQWKENRGNGEKEKQNQGKETGFYTYPVWRCKRKYQGRRGKRDIRKASYRMDQGQMQCPSLVLNECALEQSFMEMLYLLKRDYTEKGEHGELAKKFQEAYYAARRSARIDSVSFQKLEIIMEQIHETELRLEEIYEKRNKVVWEMATQKADFSDVSTGWRLPDGMERGNFSYGSCAEWEREAAIYTELAQDLQKRLSTLKREKLIFEKEENCAMKMKDAYTSFIKCLERLPETNEAGIPLNVYGRDVTRGADLKSETDVSRAPDLLKFDLGIYCGFIQEGTVYGDCIEYRTKFGISLLSFGNRRTPGSFCGFRRSTGNGSVERVKAAYQATGSRLQYRKNKGEKPEETKK